MYFCIFIFALLHLCLLPHLSCSTFTSPHSPHRYSFGFVIKYVLWVCMYACVCVPTSMPIWRADILGWGYVKTDHKPSELSGFWAALFPLLLDSFRKDTHTRCRLSLQLLIWLPFPVTTKRLSVGHSNGRDTDFS